MKSLCCRLTPQEVAAFDFFLDSTADPGSLITASADLGCIYDINAKLPTPHELVALWEHGKRRLAA